MTSARLRIAVVAIFLCVIAILYATAQTVAPAAPAPVAAPAAAPVTPAPAAPPAAAAQAATPAKGAVPAKDASYVFTAGTQLVLVPVVVTKDGKHVGGLARGVFEVEEHGKMRQISIFEEKKEPEQPVGKPGVAPVEGEDLRMTAVLFDSLNTPMFNQQDAKMKLIEYLSKTLRREEPTALYGLNQSGLKQMVPFTKKSADLLTAIRASKSTMQRGEYYDQALVVSTESGSNIQAAISSPGAPAGGISTSLDAGVNAYPTPGGGGLGGGGSPVASAAAGQAAAAAGENAQIASVVSWMERGDAMANVSQQTDNIRKTLHAFRLIARDFAGSPGRKTLIWASGGFPFRLDDPNAFASSGSDMLNEYQETWRALMKAEVVIYPVDVTGLAVDTGMDASGRVGGQVQPISMDQKQESMRTFASATGGLACVNSNDIEGCIEKAVDDSRQYYLLGYYLPSDDMKPGWRKLKVKVNIAGASVRAREGFYVPGPVENDPKKQDKLTVKALKKPDEFSGLRLVLREVPVSEGTKAPDPGKNWREYLVGVWGDSLTIDSAHDNGLDITVTSVAVDERGKNAGETQQHLTAKLPIESVMKLRTIALGVRQSLQLSAGKYDVRVVVRDNLSGELGTLQYPMEVKQIKALTDVKVTTETKDAKDTKETK